ncbi:MAG: toll/interleukin-1 receptor domain-containing protein [Lachnospiraceae bacterium]|nr:toll/interleukin-1 receptor domain-containing protein [Lachnospiraceae bacterium]
MSFNYLKQSNRLFEKYRFYLIDTSDILQDDFWKIVELPENEIRILDNKKQYCIKLQRKMPSIFISYSSMDQEIADKLVSCLEKRGLDCWIASRDIHEGSYAKQIIQAIRGASVFIVLISKNSIVSEQVKNEIDRAFNRIKEGMKIIPFILDNSELDEECEYYLCRQEMFFGQKPPVDKRIDELCKLIESIFE